MGEFSYLPLYGPLSGESFEAQTEAFFESLARRIETKFADTDITIGQFRTQVASALAGVANNAEEIGALKAQIAAQNASIAALEARLQEMEDNALFIDPDCTGGE